MGESTTIIPLPTPRSTEVEPTETYQSNSVGRPSGRQYGTTNPDNSFLRAPLFENNA